ncbi:TPA: hypothetical protein ACGFAK_004622 [Serratia marcescens]|jgi:hypothetical protein|uniref:hypothetical protein n=1 Tax=Serratia TaxID=613 RepID=UPI00101FB10F|nr:MULTISPECIES: hypothetical protein [Serratia]MBP1133530.1 hypothetical protein [Serratia sp. PL17]RYM67346.1 hypothetical protein BSQ99_24580 [Serratia liquefaciens]HBL7242125.1 hypothetical protein [Serratia liquefaciens]HDS5480588.1 hypothetical protein [Serratia liquefaciens]
MPDGVSPFLKAYITSGTNMVVGYIGEGSVAMLESLWSSPFENNSVGSMAGVSTLSNATQAASTTTSKAKINSMLVWEGQKPPEFNLSLHFMAKVDAQIEVNSAIMALQQMASPDLKNFLPGGRRPKPVVLDIGRRQKIMHAVIQSVQYELDAPRTITGMYAHNTVSLHISGMTAYNESEIPLMYI